MVEIISIEESEVPDGEGLMLTSKGKKLRVFRLHGRYHALANVCHHEGGPVCEGAVTGMLVADESTGWKPRWIREDEILYCPWHGTAFEIANGKSIVREGLCVRSYPTSVSDGKVTITLEPR
jgi:nitrite reductase (NADH) small subunit